MNYDICIVNGRIVNNKIFDSKFTFFRGKVRSQNDLVLSNSLETIDSFSVMDKYIYSDHTPTSTIITVDERTPLNLLNSCADGIFNDNHWDINKRRLPPLVFSRIDWANVIPCLEEKSRQITNSLQSNSLNNDELDALISSTIYDTCKTNYKINESVCLPASSTSFCNSKNFKAIADMNLFTYNFHTRNGASMEIRNPYLENYLKYQQLAMEAENQEVCAKRNTAWRTVKKDVKKLWENIDWKGQADTKNETLIHESEITPYFKNIFQSEKTKDHPKITDIRPLLESHQIHIPSLDCIPQQNELDFAVKKVGNGSGIDGIPANIIKIMPPCILDNILALLQRTFMGSYPKLWEKQLLNAIPKTGHTSKEPKLRGVAIAPMFARIYDAILNARFQEWYVPNREQAGFRRGQGCLLQLFIVILLIDYSKDKKRDFFIGYLDYEKAFDYANRARIVTKLIEKGCGSLFTNAIAKMYESTTYIPVTNNKLCEEIPTAYGVAQGRHSSPNLYSFYVSDMPQCTDDLGDDDFMDPFNLAQLADDTVVLAETVNSFKKKMNCLLTYSKKILQVPNISKTVFCHFSENPILETIDIGENSYISSVDITKGHKYLGMKFVPTNDVNKIIRTNLNERMNNFCKFYSWLEVNVETPIEIKLLVLDNCMFNSILYAVETWGDITHIEDKLMAAERKALKCVLKVKSSTSNDVIYNELKRPDIVSKIKELQWKFFQRVKKLNEEEALVVSIMRICRNSSRMNYYETLSSDSRKNNVRNREERIVASNSSMLKYYCSINDVYKKSSIYQSYVDDEKRSVITRWRLSNHKLRIETDRYHNPPILRNDRKCETCGVLEDEQHAIFYCPSFYPIRMKYTDLLKKYDSVKSLLDPEVPDIYKVSKLLSEIDDILNDRMV